MNTDLTKIILSINKVNDIVNDKMYMKTNNMFHTIAKPRNFKTYLYSQTGEFLMESLNRGSIYKVTDLINNGPILKTDLNKYVTVFPNISIHINTYAFMIDIDLKLLDPIDYDSVQIKDFIRINDVIKSIVGNKSNIYILESGIRKVRYESKKDLALSKDFYKFGYHIFVECGKYDRRGLLLRDLYSNLKAKINPIITEINAEYTVDMAMSKNLSFVNGSSKINSEFKFIKLIRNNGDSPAEIINIPDLAPDVVEALNIECFEVSTLQLNVHNLPDVHFKLDPITYESTNANTSNTVKTNLTETYDILMQDLNTNSKKIDIVQTTVDDVKDTVIEFRSEINEIKDAINQLKEFIISLSKPKLD